MNGRFVSAACAAACLLFAIGCKKETPDTPASEQQQYGKTAQGEGGGDIAPMTPAIGPITPVAGAENVGGGGSGVGDAMKAKARGLAAQSPSSLGGGGEEGQ